MTDQLPEQTEGTPQGQAVFCGVFEALRSLPTVQVRALRDEALTQAPEWQDVGRIAEHELHEREYRRGQA